MNKEEINKMLEIERRQTHMKQKQKQKRNKECLRKKFEPKLKTIEDKLWQICREIVYRRDNIKGRVHCYTCSQTNLIDRNRQLGHGYPKSALGASMKYELRILKFQCYNCNINLGGAGAIFWKNLERDSGKEEADKLYAECGASKGKPVKARPYYLSLMEKYKKMVKKYKYMV